MNATVDYVVRLTNDNPQDRISPSPRWRGDILLCRVRPHNGLGLDMKLPTYGVITVHDIQPSVAQSKVVRRHTEFDEQGRELFHCRAGRWINIDKLVPEQRQQLEMTGNIEMTALEFISRLNDRVEAMRQSI